LNSELKFANKSSTVTYNLDSPAAFSPLVVLHMTNVFQFLCSRHHLRLL